MYQVMMTETGDYQISIALTANTKLEGTYIDAENAAAPKIPDIQNVAQSAATTAQKSIKTITSTNDLTVAVNSMSSLDIKNYFNTNEYFVTGVTSSKFDSLIKSFVHLPVKSIVNESYGVNSVIPTKQPDSSSVLDQKILINGTNIYGMILRNDLVKEYVLYVDSEYPIKYIDFPDGTTNFKYKAAPDYKIMDGKILYYDSLVDQPKILSEVFIDRGVNNVFEPVKRLKNVDNLKELMKIGLGYYKINSTGFNFKNAK